MPNNKKEKTRGKVVDLRHTNATRLNIPPAGLAARGEIVREKKVQYAYNPHLSPVLRFDGTGGADRIEKLIEEAGRRQLNREELQLLQEALRNHEPWLEWAGKREQQWCVTDPVALHIHERISAQAILRVAQRQDVDRDLFADPEQEYREAVQFYKYPMDWANRMILGDSLAVMASLARRETLAGKVQMLYVDPPYGIKFKSNFQNEVGDRDVKDGDKHLTREPEMIKAYRDTWTLGVHSYLSYLRDRFLLCKELLADTGSIFVQISDENLHRVRSVMDEVFLPKNFCGIIQFAKTTKSSSKLLPVTVDYLLWYSREKDKLKFRPIFSESTSDPSAIEDYDYVETQTGEIRPRRDGDDLASLRLVKLDDSSSQGESKEGPKTFCHQGRDWYPTPGRHFSQEVGVGMPRLALANLLHPKGERLFVKNYSDRTKLFGLTGSWLDTQLGGFKRKTENIYVVQTATKVIEHCVLMTTDPGDLVLDPTCGSGTTAYVAEQWGRRWITIDTSRVALALARQRLLTSKYDYYQLRQTSGEDMQRNLNGIWLTDPEGKIQGASTFDCRTVPHITMKRIAQNQALDPIFAKWELVLAEKVAKLNKALTATVTKELRQALLLKLQQKIKADGKRSVTDADRRRWEFPEAGWKEWEVPFDADPDWPAALADALKEYRQAWRQKMDEVNACIAACAKSEELVDQPKKDSSKVRVSGPFTMEGIIPAEESIDLEPEPESPIEGSPEELQTFGEGEGSVKTEAKNAEAYVDRMIRLLREDGVRFPDNKVMKFKTLEILTDGSILHANGTWGEGAEEQRVAVMVGPQFGPLIAPMVEEGVRAATRRGFDVLVFAAFSVDGAAQVVIQEDVDPKLRVHMAQIRPDVTMGDLLKTTVSSQLFTVSGSPRTELKKQEDGQYVVEMQGVDIYDPVTNAVRSAGAEKVAAWFVDSDYDGRCFCITQAFFPDESAWEKLANALKTTLDADVFAKLSGTVSLPFPLGQHKRVAVKVIDPRGNEVMRIHRVGDTYA